MGAPLLGPADGLIRLIGSSSSEVTVPDQSTFVTYIDNSVQEQRWDAPRRTWSVGVNTAQPEEWQALQQLMAGLAGQPPWVWYDEASQVENILSPSQSHLEAGTWAGSGFSEGGRDVASDGTVFLRSLTADTGATIEFFTDLGGLLPVPGASPLTASVYATAFTASSGTVTVEEIDPQGAVVAVHALTIPAGTIKDRFPISITTSIRTIGLRMRAANALMVTLPAVTLTREAQPWANGQGCHTATAMLHDKSTQLAFVIPNDWGRRAGYSMTVQELD